MSYYAFYVFLPIRFGAPNPVSREFACEWQFNALPKANYRPCRTWI
jgi:hypothetical protein